MLQTRNLIKSSLRREAWLEINLTSLEYNLDQIKSWINLNKTQIMAVLKSDAYGNGAIPVAEVLIAKGIKWFAVASIDEAIALRNLNNEISILILGPIPNWSIITAAEHNIDLTLTSYAQIKSMLNYINNKKISLNIHLKIDSGMHRLGINPQEITTIVNLITANPYLKLVSIFSHLALAHDYKKCHKQFQTFTNCLKIYPCTALPITHLASSQAIRLFKFTHLDMVRSGLYLYGLEPCNYSTDLKPILSLKARINQIMTVSKDEGVGYDFTYILKRDSLLAVIPIGYADGIDRGLSNKLQGLINGKIIQQIGLISMDQMIFDITNTNDVSLGDVIELITDVHPNPINSTINPFSLAHWANLLNTSTYELSTRLNGRLPKMYIRNTNVS